MNNKQYLYLIEDDNRFKIGYSKNPKKRYLDYKLHNPTFVFKGIFQIQGEIPNSKGLGFS